MKKKWLLTIGLVILTGIVIGCTDTTTETGSGLPEEGFIKGTVTTARADGKPVTFTFEHTVRDYPTEFYPGGTYVGVWRAKDFLGDWTGDDYSRIRFYMDSLNQDTVSFLYNFTLYSIVSLANDTVMPWGFNIYYPGPGAVTNYQYDNGTVSGSFHVSGTANNGATTTIVGTFKSKVRIMAYEGSD